MFNFLKRCFISTLLFTNVLGFNNSIFSLDYNIYDDYVELISTVNITGESYWWIGIGMQNDNLTDTIICWNGINNTIQLEAFSLNNEIMNNINSTIFEYKKNYPYFIRKNSTLENNTLKTTVSRYLNTGNQILLDNNLNIVLYKGNTIFPSKEQYMYSIIVNITDGNINSAKRGSLKSFELNMFYPSISTFFIFFVFIIICILSQTSYIKNRYVKIFYFGYYNVGSIIFISLYTVWWIGMCVYCFFTNDKGEMLFRLGIWIMLNTSNMLMPITRNSIWLLLFKIPYLKIIHLHRYMAVLCIFSVIIKFVTVLVLYPPSFLILVLNTDTGGSPLAGTLSTLCYIIIGIFAFPQIRNKCFELFYFSHRIFSVLAIATSIWHYFISLYYILPAFTLYIIDMIIRYASIHKALYTKLDKVGSDEHNTSCIVLNIRMLKNINTYPGCYFLICIRNISSFEWHPISLVDNKNKKLIFCAKDMGNNSWTSKLKNLDNKEHATVDELFEKEVYLQGPYGSINFDYSKYKYIINIAGGIGVTSIFSILSYINEMYYLKKLNKLEKILFIWVIPHISLLEYFNNYILSLNHKITDIEIYVTKQKIDKNYPLYIKNFKPNITEIIENFITSNNISVVDTSIATCGPPRLIDDVKLLSNKLNIDVFCEDF